MADSRSCLWIVIVFIALAPLVGEMDHGRCEDEDFSRWRGCPPAR